jgi:uncharacterized repeat protein (TIGR01451 family)
MELDKQIITACAYTKYDYEIRKNEEEKSHSLSNNLIVDIVSPKIRFVQTLTSPQQINQEFLTYQLLLENEGDIAIFNIYICNPTSKYLEFCPNSLTIDGVETEYNIFTGFNYERLDPKQRVIINYKVAIKKEFLTFKITNLSTMNYEYKIEDNIYKESLVSNTVYADIVVELLSAIKSTNKRVITLNETTTITTIINNVGNTPINNLKIEEISNKNYSLIENSIFINGTLSDLTDPNTIVIPLIKENSQIVISYDIKTNRIPNKDNTIEIESLISYTSNNTVKTIKTNKVKIDIKYAQLLISKTVDKLKARSSEHLSYLIEVKNIGNIKAKNIYFSDTISEGMKFVPGSICIDNVSRTELNPSLGFFLKDLDAQKSTIITYKVVITI